VGDCMPRGSASSAPALNRNSDTISRAPGNWMAKNASSLVRGVGFSSPMEMIAEMPLATRSGDIVASLRVYACVIDVSL
jgi:hypothetical protein